MTETTSTTPPAILIVGASRGLGQAMAAEFLKRGWSVVGTVRDGTARTALHDLADRYEGRVDIEVLDVNVQEQIAALRKRLEGRRFEILFVSAGTTVQDKQAEIGDVTTEEFIRVMTTNALGPMRVVEAFKHLVPATGLIGAMSSGQGSIANNLTGTREVYRGSKAALNMFMRSFAARPAEAARTTVLMVPGWVRTALGGPDAPLGTEESVPGLASVLLSKQRTPGLHFVDYLGMDVPW